MITKNNKYNDSLAVTALLFGLIVSYVEARVTPRLVLGGGLTMTRNNFSNPSFDVPGLSNFPSSPYDTCEHCVCGVSRQSRIVNGDITNTNEFPWAVSITYQGAHHCGASLITRKHLLTAAHCIARFQKKFFGLRFADNGHYRIKYLSIHPGYDRVSYDNDIALIELDEQVPLDGVLKTVCLPDAARFSYIGATGVAIGWGRIGEGEPVSRELRKVDLPVMSEDECKLSDYAKNRLTNNMFCAGYLDGKRDACGGDSGGAFHIRSATNGAMEVIGLVSFGRGCARPNFPGVYTKVPNYLGWIAGHTRDECLCSPPR